MARPVEVTDESIAAIVGALEVGCPARVACRAGGVRMATFRAGMALGKSDEEANAPYRAFRAAVARARAEAEVEALRVIREAMPSRWQAAAWFLERSRPRRWGRVDRLKATLAADGRGAARIRVTYEDLSGIPDAELRDIADGKAGVTMGGKGYAAGTTPLHLWPDRPATR